MEDHKKRSYLTGVILFCLLSGLMAAVIYKMDPDIFQVLKSLSLQALIFLAVINFVYQLFEALINLVIFRRRIGDYSLKNALDVVYLGIFAKVLTSSGGTLPMQSYYLHRKGLMVGSSIGLLSLQYILHKVFTLICASVFLLLNWSYIHQNLPAIYPYLLLAYGVCILVIVLVVLACVWKKAHDLLIRLLNRLPDTEKWAHRKDTWSRNVDALYREAGLLLQNKQDLAAICVLEILKLLSLYITTCFCSRILGIRTLSCFRLAALTAVMFLISNALPNISGMGSVEFSFFLIFSPVFGDLTLSVLLLYRAATYYFPFFLSVIWFVCVERKWLKMRHRQPDPDT